MGMTWQEADVRKVYAGIVRQAITDISKPTCSPGMTLDIHKFFTSAWGEHVLDVLKLDFAIIDKKFKITERAKKAKKEKWEAGL